MITPDQITNGAVFKDRYCYTVITGSPDRPNDAVNYVELYHDGGIGLHERGSLIMLSDWLDDRNATLCPELKLAVVEK